MIFAERFKLLRRERGLTQERVAHDLDVPESTVRRWETGNGMPKNERLPVIASYFDVTVDFLMGESEERQNKTIIYKLSPQEMAIKELVERYNIDVTRSGAMEKLERMVQIVFEDDKGKSDGK